MSHFYSMQAWLLAPTYVLVGEPIDSRTGKLTALDDGSVVALFTSTESAREFAETYYAEEDISSGLTQRELARIAGVGKGTVFELEVGRRGAYPRTVRRLAKALETEISTLVKE